MLHKLKDLRGDRVAASDGEIGQVDEIYFDDEDWHVRYFVVDTGGWLSGRKVLISPVSIDRSRSNEKAIAVSLSRDQVEHSPNVDEHKPVSRQYEEAYSRYYGYSLYWAPPEASAMPTRGRAGAKARKLKAAEREASESHLRSSDAVIGYAIHATDGAIGHIDDLVVDDRDWAIADLLVDTGAWLPGKKVLVPPSAVEAIDWGTRELRLGMRREDIDRGAPSELPP